MPNLEQKGNHHYVIGQKITVDHILKRDANKKARFWKPMPIKPTEVYVIGLRSLADGYVETFGNVDDEEEDDLSGVFFVTSKRFPALLVVQNLRYKPFYVKI